MSETTEPGPLGNRISLYDHAVRLHRLHPDTPLPDDGRPYPDGDAHRRRVERPGDHRRQGVAAAAILDAFFARSDAAPDELAWAFHDVDVPIHLNDHITAAALRADRERVQEAGRRLVRRSPDQCSVVIGLALLAADWDEQDIDLIRHIGLLSYTFGPLAAHALKRRIRGGGQALLWLAQRTAGWGRVYVIEALCEREGRYARPWLLRHALDGDFLNGYYAGAVAHAADVHEAITAPDPDDELVDHTGRLLQTMADNSGMGMTWNDYYAVRRVLDAHLAHLARQEPAYRRYITAAHIADRLRKADPDVPGLPPDHQARLLEGYLAILRRDDWSSMARAALDPADEFAAWFLANTAARLHLLDRRPGDDAE